MIQKFSLLKYFTFTDNKNFIATVLWLLFSGFITYIIQIDADHQNAVKYVIHYSLQTVLLFILLYFGTKNYITRSVILISITTDAVVRYAYGSDMNISVWMSIFQAPFSEITTFINSNGVIIGLGFGVSALLLLLPKPQVPPLVIKACTVISLAYIIVPTTINLSQRYNTYEHEIFVQSRLASGSTQNSANIQFTMNELGNRLAILTSLSGLIQSIDYAAQSNTFTDNKWSNVTVDATGSDLLVMVIGESTRASNMSVYGYSRTTTPNLDRLSEAGQIRAYENAYSAGTNTWNSLPNLLTYSNENQDKRLSIIKLVQQAGYKTYWLSNQEEADKWGRAIVTITDQSDESVFINSGGTTVPFDSDLIPHFNTVLNIPGKKLIVLHLYATHAAFKMRYPPEGHIFKDTQNSTAKQTLLNSYDNSIYYVDSLLNEIIEKTKDSDGRFVYFSDHGLTSIHSDRPLVHDVGKRSKKDSLHVPLIFAGSNLNPLPKKEFYSLYYFECIFAAWASINATELSNNDFCKNTMEKQYITYIGADLEIRKVAP